MDIFLRPQFAYPSIAVEALLAEENLQITEKTRLKRVYTLGRHDRATINSILDATPLCHVGYVRGSAPFVTPTLHWREGDRIYWHGSSASAAIRAAEGFDVCLTVSILDGLVLARSGFHHSANFRSVMMFGRAEMVVDPQAKAEKLKKFLDIFYPGRWEELRPMTDQELKATSILSLPIEEASAKIRTGPPKDEEADYELPIWAGVIPSKVDWGAPVADPRNPAGLDVPEYAVEFNGFDKK